MKLDPFYLIVDDVSWLRRLLPMGVRLVQLRIKDRSDPEIREQVVTARRLCARAGACLIVNDYWRIALDEGCDFVHLGQSDLDEADVPALRKAGVRIGISTHSPDELERALTFKPDYIALGPVYPTTLKVMPWAPQGLARVAEWKRLIAPIPLVAIGGLTVERLPGIFRAGADSAAVVSDVIRHATPETRAREWIEATRSMAAK
ncbi:thiamine-phosphate synthase [Steroidobacter agaridevorans]|uniref:Thiamine-phosphate synthase n=1 Tax=Steroidobacter agaridevorans TaxID=2695856 RepID=A0A829YB15_9GAMM|nr:thiamine phosphate synthase [Steroidobacter agaridevorans]GFE80477.1 thiamine-phosphate synthase [Steroidobacter agaridevorans]